VLFRAGGVTAALPAEAVAAVLAPQRPLPAPPGAAARGVAGLAAHRGAVLPVRDGGRALGGAPVLAGGEAPLIRLALEPEWLLAVSEVLGVRRAPETEIVPAGGGLVTAIARLGGEALPLLAPRGLAA
jgi:chemotaxis signal transduction protein